MKTLSKILKTFWLEESGLTIVEYAVAASLVTAAVILVFTDLGAAVAARIQQLVNVINP